MAILRGLDLERFRLGTKTAFTAGLDSGRDAAQWSRIAQRVASTASSEHYPFLDSVPGMREFVDERVQKNLKVNDYTLANASYESTVTVPSEFLMDNQVAGLFPIFERLGMRASQFIEKKVFTALKNGFTGLCYDGLPFFSNAHPNGATTTSNISEDGGAEWCLLDTTAGIMPLIYQDREPAQLIAKTQPTDENVFYHRKFIYGAYMRCAFGYGMWQTAYGSTETLSASNFDSAMEAMMSFKDPEGEPLGIRPNILVVGPSNRSQALAILEAQYLASGASNTNYKSVELIVSPYFT